MMKESAKGTPEYEQYKKEFIALCETYDRLEEEWYKENPNPNAHLKGKDEPTPRHIKWNVTKNKRAAKISYVI